MLEGKHKSIGYLRHTQYRSLWILAMLIQLNANTTLGEEGESYYCKDTTHFSYKRISLVFVHY